MIPEEAKILFTVAGVALSGLAVWVVYLNMTVKRRWVFDAATDVPDYPALEGGSFREPAEQIDAVKGDTNDPPAV